MNNTPAKTFDTHLPAFKEVQEAPWGRLRYTVAAANLGKHLPPKPLNILDLGGGNGLDAIPLVHQGHRVTILDYAPEMLVEGRKNAREQGLSELMTFCQADVSASQPSSLTPNLISSSATTSSSMSKTHPGH